MNILELKATFLTTKAFPKHRMNITVYPHMDNTTVFSHVINKEGMCSPQLVNLTLDLCQWCIQRLILITAQHLSTYQRNSRIWSRENQVLQLQWMANKATCDPVLHQSVHGGPLCLPPNTSSNACQLGTGSWCYLPRCNDLGLVTSERQRLSNF